MLTFVVVVETVHWVEKDSFLLTLLILLTSFLLPTEETGCTLPCAIQRERFSLWWQTSTSDRQGKHIMSNTTQQSLLTMMC